MKAVLCLVHPDTISGTTTLADGTKIYWSEGGSAPTVIHPDGRIEVIPPYTAHPILEDLDTVPVTRQMTQAEYYEYERVVQKHRWTGPLRLVSDEDFTEDGDLNDPQTGH